MDVSNASSVRVTEEPNKVHRERLSEGTMVAAYVVTGSTGPRCFQSGPNNYMNLQEKRTQKGQKAII